MDTMEKIKNILVDYKGEEMEISEDTQFSDLGFDSLDTAELVMRFEDEFEIELNETENIKTVGDVVNLINSKL